MGREAGKSKWGWGISVLFIGFVLFILALVISASLQDVQLVEDNYYQKGLDYQGQIDRMERADKLEKNVSASYNSTSGNIEVVFPVMENMELSGVIKMFRPSNAGLDFDVPIQVDSSGVQEIKADRMLHGYWQIKILWKADSLEYFSQLPLIIN